MSEGELRNEAMSRLDRKLDRMGIVAPDEEFSQSELREMMSDELRQVYEEQEERSWFG